MVIYCLVSAVLTTQQRTTYHTSKYTEDRMLAEKTHIRSQLLLWCDCGCFMRGSTRVILARTYVPLGPVMPERSVKNYENESNNSNSEGEVAVLT